MTGYDLYGTFKIWFMNSEGVLVYKRFPLNEKYKGEHLKNKLQDLKNGNIIEIEYKHGNVAKAIGRIWSNLRDSVQMVQYPKEQKIYFYQKSCGVARENFKYLRSTNASRYYIQSAPFIRFANL